MYSLRKINGRVFGFYLPRVCLLPPSLLFLSFKNRSLVHPVHVFIRPPLTHQGLFITLWLDSSTTLCQLGFFTMLCLGFFSVRMCFNTGRVFTSGRVFTTGSIFILVHLYRAGRVFFIFLFPLWRVNYWFPIIMF